MIGQEDPPGFEDLEPEGKEVERYPSLENGNGQEFETLAADDAPMGSAGLDDPDEDEAFASLDDGLERLDGRFPRRSPANGFHSSPPSGRQTAGRLQGGQVGEGAGGVAALAKDDELMLALAAAAALAESRAEAERLVVALVPLSLRLVPAVSRALWPALPALIEGAAGLTRLLYAHPETRPLIAEVPILLRRAIWRLSGYVLDGRPVTRRLATGVLNHHAAALLNQARHQAVPPRRRAGESQYDTSRAWGAG